MPRLRRPQRRLVHALVGRRRRSLLPRRQARAARLLPRFAGLAMRTRGAHRHRAQWARAHHVPARACRPDVPPGIAATRRRHPGPVPCAGPAPARGQLNGGDFCGRRVPYRLYFAVAFDRPFRSLTGRPLEGRWLTFDTSPRPQLEMRVAVSYVSAAGARRNLRSGTAGSRFDDMRRAAAAGWRRVLGRVRVEGGTRAERRRFYTGLYHSFIHPSRFSDADGRYWGTGWPRPQTRQRQTRFPSRLPSRCIGIRSTGSCNSSNPANAHRRG